MRNLRRAFRITLVVVIGLWMHYVLPQRDVVKVVETTDRSMNLSNFQRLFYAQEDAGTQESASRHVRFVHVNRVKTYLFGIIRTGQGPMEYRNEDTGWIYPPYFKFDSSRLETESAAAARTEDWYVITHYGWRIPFLSIYPNAVSIRPVPDGGGPEYRPFPWLNLIVYAAMIGAFFFVRAMWRQFRERTIDPLAGAAGDRMDEMSAGVAERRSRFRRWLESWKSKPRR